MRSIEKLLEIEALTESVSKRLASNNLLKIKMLYFISQYENMSVGMIVERLGMKKSNFALMTKQLEKERLVVCKHGEMDKRVRLLYLTDLGKARLKDFIESYNNFFVGECEEVSKAIDVLCRYLNKKL